MIGRTNTGGGSGGGGGLNFNIIGGTSAPKNPKENDIWVNTNTEISEWVFSSDIPIRNEVTAKVATKEVYLNSNGVLTDSTNYSVTDYTALPENATHIMVRHSASGSTGVYHEFSDASKKKISLVARGTGDTVYEIPTNAVYVRLSVRASTGYEDSLAFALYTVEDEGILWISTGASSPVEFNALKKNNITVYPISAKQYVSGAWVDKTAKSYQNGAWVEWITYLFKEGEGEKVQFAITGSTVNIGTDGIAFSGSSSKGLYADVAVTLEKTSTFCVEATITNVGTSDTYMGSVVAKTPSVYSSTRNDHPQTATARAKISADGVRTVYKLSLGAGTYHFGVSGNIVGTVHNMWYE